MISDFEQALATLLGLRLPVPFAGHVVVAPPPAAGADPMVVVGVTAITPTTPGFGDQLPQQTPAIASSHRVLRLDCVVTMTVVASTGHGRTQEADGVQQVLWALDDPDVRTGVALADGTDRGFVLEQLAITGGTTPLDPAADPPVATAATAMTSGWFWPVGLTGAIGRVIGEVRVRGVALPVLVSPTSPTSTPGGPPVVITVSVQLAASTQLTTTGAAEQPLPFTGLIATLRGAGGTVATGTLVGGTGGTTTLRTYPVTNGTATVTYQPPGQGASDVLAVALDDGAGGAGIVIGSVPIEVH